MNKAFLILVFICPSILGCHGSTAYTSKDSAKTIKDTSLILPENADTTADVQTQAEERQRISQSYTTVNKLDTDLYSTQDTFHLHVKYFCQLDKSISIPKSYEDDSSAFITHPFVSDVLIIHGDDTIFNKRIDAEYFAPYYEDNFGGNLKKYGSLLLPPSLSRKSSADSIVLDCPISIPSTDIGMGFRLAVSKTGSVEVSH